MKKILLLCVMLICVFFVSNANAASNINVVINGKAVAYSEGTGYPYRDGNNQIMVPFHATMQMTGSALGYDASKAVAIMITANDRVEVMVHTNVVYVNNRKVDSVSTAVINNGIIYVPIKTVLEEVDYTVEWDENTQTVNVYNYDFDSNSLVPYSTSSLEQLATNILNGNVVYLNGQYYATPEYMRTLMNVQIHYVSDDLNISIYPMPDRFAPINIDMSNEDLYVWISSMDLEQETNIVLRQGVRDGDNIDFDKWIFKEVSELSGIVRAELYIVDDMTDEFMEASEASGVFSGIRMKKQYNDIYFYRDDLVDLGIISADVFGYGGGSSAEQPTQGWVEQNGSWNYLEANGTKKTGWLQDGFWYYFDANGNLMTGWMLEGTTWYYLNSSGSMATGWTLVENKWYYFDTTGAMITGWVNDGGKYRYCMPTGEMLVNAITPDGYQVDALGVWVQ